MAVHNHGPEEGEGLACNELRLPDGSRKGKCLMSSNYYVLCMSHDPSTVVTENSMQAMAEEGIIQGFENHPNCDFLIMRVSGAPVEFICTGITEACKHPHVKEVDADWLRLLAYFDPTEDRVYLQKIRERPALRCWTPNRLHRLRNHL